MIARTARFTALLLGVLLAGLLAAPPVSAQSDPYGSTTTTAPEGEIEATCTLSLARGEPGSEVTAVVSGVFYGEHVRILFDGLQVAEVTAPDEPLVGGPGDLPHTGSVVAQSVGAPVIFGAADDGTTSVTVKFVVPKAAPGTHVVTAVGDTFTCFCNPKGQFEVLATGSGGGSLVRTGVEAGLVLVIAVALLLVGRTLVGASRRARRVEPDTGRVPEDRAFTSVER